MPPTPTPDRTGTTPVGADDEAFDLLGDAPDDRDTALLLDALPEFVPWYLALVRAVDDSPGAPSVFTELASFVADRLAPVESQELVLQRALDALETVASRGAESSELVGYAFLDSLGPDERRMIAPRLGPHTRSLLDEIELGS